MKTVYKVLSSLSAIAILPALFFLPLLRFKMTLPMNLDLGIREYSSVFDMIRMHTSRTEEQNKLLKTLLEALTDPNSELGKIFTNRPWLYAFLVFFCLTVLITLALAVLPYLTKRRPWIPLAAAGGGFVSALLMNFTFTRFAKPLLSGMIGLRSVLGGAGAGSSGGLGGLFTDMLGSAVSVDQLKLSFAYEILLALLAVYAVVVIAGIAAKKNAK